MKLSEEKMKHILKPGVKILSDLLGRAGFEIRVVGGAVRDLMMDMVPTDLDIATTAPFSEMKRLFDSEEEVRILRSSEKNNTILVRIEEQNLDCTTLFLNPQPSSIAKDPEVTTSWEIDASHRDLTINALYIGLDGTIYDYFNGLEHLEKRVVTFVIDPDKRIEEDPLRILRYFRFFGRVARGDPRKHDAAALESIRRHCSKVSTLSAEVIWKEIKLIVQGNFGGDLFLQMMECGITHHVGFPADFDSENLKQTYKRLLNAELESQVDPCTLLASGFSNEDDLSDFVIKLRLSHREKDIMKHVIAKKFTLSSDNLLKDIQHILVDLVYKDKRSTKAAIDVASELCKFAGRSDLLNEITKDLIPEFPLKGGMLVDRVERKRIHREMKRLLNLWQESDYSLGCEELLNKIET